MDGPNALSCTFPERNVDPVEIVQIVEDTSSVNYKIILPVVDEDSLSHLQQSDYVTCITTRDVCCEIIVNIVISSNEVGILVGTKFCATVVEEGSKSAVSFAVLPEIVSAHTAPVFIAGVIIVGDKIEILSGLDMI